MRRNEIAIVHRFREILIGKKISKWKEMFILNDVIEIVLWKWHMKAI